MQKSITSQCMADRLMLQPAPRKWKHRLPTYSKPEDDVDLTRLDTPWAYVLHGEQSLHHHARPANVLAPLKDVKYEGDLELVAMSIPP